MMVKLKRTHLQPLRYRSLFHLITKVYDTAPQQFPTPKYTPLLFKIYITTDSVQNTHYCCRNTHYYQSLPKISTAAKNIHYLFSVFPTPYILVSLPAFVVGPPLMSVSLDCGYCQSSLISVSLDRGY